MVNGRVAYAKGSLSPPGFVDGPYKRRHVGFGHGRYGAISRMSGSVELRAEYRPPGEEIDIDGS